MVVISVSQETAIQLVPDGTLLFHLVLIVVMVALLNATLLKPINRILEERDRRTKGRLSEAQSTLEHGEREDCANMNVALAKPGRRICADGAGTRRRLSRERERKMASVKSRSRDLVATQRRELCRAGRAGEGKLDGRRAGIGALEISQSNPRPTDRSVELIMS